VAKRKTKTKPQAPQQSAQPDPAAPIPFQQEPELAFRIQMRVSNFVLGYWKESLLAIGGVLTIALAFGLWEGHVESKAQEASAAVYRVDLGVPELSPLARLGLDVGDDLNDPERTAELQKAAEDYLTVADKHGNAAGTRARMKAADVWLRLSESAKAQEALAAAHADGAAGMLGYAAGSRYATMLADADETDKALAVYAELSKRLDGFPAEAAILDTLHVAGDAGNTAEVERAAKEFRSRFPKSTRLDEVERLATIASDVPTTEEAADPVPSTADPVPSTEEPVESEGTSAE